LLGIIFLLRQFSDICLGSCLRFSRPQVCHYIPLSYEIVWQAEGACLSETFAPIYQNTRCNDSDDHSLHLPRCCNDRNPIYLPTYQCHLHINLYLILFQVNYYWFLEVARWNSIKNRLYLYLVVINFLPYIIRSLPLSLSPLLEVNQRTRLHIYPSGIRIWNMELIPMQIWGSIAPWREHTVRTQSNVVINHLLHMYIRVCVCVSAYPWVNPWGWVQSMYVLVNLS
jgi:hypothetical protein